MGLGVDCGLVLFTRKLCLNGERWCLVAKLPSQPCLDGGGNLLHVLPFSVFADLSLDCVLDAFNLTDYDRVPSPRPVDRPASRSSSGRALNACENLPFPSLMWFSLQVLRVKLESPPGSPRFRTL